ncbi:Nramp family divalent metal transporter [Ramlibacter tataouinensis]|uniref:Nramp family divalent metal transporter n=1 Tax=Ramlibacter tataouinensis TaxID=94132 RepID=UPI0022F3B76D|nr:Nramp family divalent metal transporter [Ramlibacter tataouinensis]WBY01112.1 Nramp family divalent metal transporter [Ramlibacter tataouinensis]
MLGLGLITGAADDDPSAVGTYAAAGARFGYGLLWMAPFTLPMMFTVVYLSAKLAMVSGRGLFHAIRDFYPRWVLYPLLAGVIFGNVVEAAADLGGMAAALNLFVPAPIPWLVAALGVGVLALQCFAPYEVIRNVFRWLALALLAYVGAAILARPDLRQVLRGVVAPRMSLDSEYLSLVVAMIGTTLSAYLYTWQSNQEVEEEIVQGRTTVRQRQGASRSELRSTRRDVLAGMVVSNLIMFSIMVATGTTLHASGRTQIESAAQAAQALRPLAGDAAGLLFATGVVGVGLLAVPVMTAGAAYDIAQTFGWKHSLHARPRQAKAFYGLVALVTAIAIGLNTLGFNPMKALVWSGIVQGFSVPPLLLLIMLMTNDRRIMGDQVNKRGLNVLGWATTAVVTAATVTLVVVWLS